MADYKILGNEEPVTAELAKITEGLGFPLRSIDTYVPGAAGTGDVVGPVSSANNAIARFNGTTGKEIKDSSGATLSDTGVISAPGIVASGEAGYDVAASMGTGPEAFTSKEYVDSFVVETEQIITAFSGSTQEPTALDTPIQLTFGPAQAGLPITVDASGNFLVNETDEYNVRLRLMFGRATNPGSATLVARVLIDGVQIGESVHAILSDTETVVPTTFEGVVPLTAGQVITVEMYRDSVGNNDGGIFAFTPTIGTWAASPSCVMTIIREHLVQM